MRTYKCYACRVERDVKTSSICPACYALVDPDPNKKIINPEREKLIPVYEQRASQEQPLFPAILRKAL